MIFRTDLAIEAREQVEKDVEGVTTEELNFGKAAITRMKITSSKGEQAMGRPMGNYITVQVPPFSDNCASDDETLSVLTKELSSLMPKEGPVLVVGLGNEEITPDALGPKVAQKTLATRHITGEFARSLGLGNLRSVAVIAPGVLGQTGIETAELIAAVVRQIGPSCVIVIDALASRSLARLGCTVQITDTGISPGSGVHNMRPQLNEQALGVPVIAMGIPTVVDAATLAHDLTENSTEIQQKIQPRGAKMMVTPKEIDLLVDRGAIMVSLAINSALHPSLSVNDILALVS